MKKLALPAFTAFLSCFLLPPPLFAGSISGVVRYADEQTGSIQILASRTLPGNKSLKLDSDGDYVFVDSLTDLSGSAISVQYWFRGSSIQSAVRQQGGGSWIVAGWNNQHILSQDGGTGGISAGDAVIDGEWHHVTMTWEQNTPGGFRSYLDGRLVEQRDSVDAPIPNINAPLFFGSFNGNGEFANGELDEISVWERALTPEEVRDNWFRKRTGSEEGLVGYWNFDDGTADDLSPNGHYGELAGDADIVESDIPGLDAFFMAELGEPGAFSIDGVPDGDGYRVWAFLDVDGDGRRGELEPSALYNSGNLFAVSGDATGIDLLLLDPPQITAHPADIRIGAGTEARLGVAASGSQPLSYQWRRYGEDLADGGNISGAASPELVIRNAAADHSGAYNCRVANGAGEAFSNTASVLVIEGGLSISGVIQYEGSQTGPVHIAASQIQEGNRVLSLDGNGDFAITTLTDLSGSEIAVQYWFRGSSIQSAVRQQSGGNYIVAGWRNQHILSFDGDTSGISAGAAATDGNWHHIAMTWKPNARGGFRSYLDGRLIEQRDSADAEIPNLNAQVYFGAFNGQREFANGQLDEIAIWERALSEGEMAIGWNVPLTGNEEGLIGFWNFDDGIGQDLSGFGNHAELHGDAAILEETVSGLGSDVFAVVLESPGGYTLDNILPGDNFEVTAFLDVNGNGAPDEGEPAGEYANNPFVFAQSASDVDILLTEPPRILDQPVDARVASDADSSLAKFTVQAAGSAPLSYQWRKDGENLSSDNNGFRGVNSPTLQIVNVRGDGEYSVLVSNEKGSALSRRAKLFVVPADNVSLAGNLRYTGLPAGKIHVVAAEFLPGNQVLKLDGTGDFVEVAGLDDLAGEEITIQYWFRGRSIQSAVRQQSGGWIVAGWNNQHILSNDGGTDGISAGANLDDGNWHHIAMTWKIDAANGFRSYLDGKLVEQRDSSAEEIPFHAAALYFGSFNGQREFAEGELDEIAIWDRALDESEIQAGWNHPLAGDEEGLIGLWKFDDGTADDFGQYGYHGELRGDASLVPANIPGFGNPVFTDVFDEAGAFSMPRLPKGDNYRLAAFVDVNGNFLSDPDEPRAVYASNPFSLAEDLDGIELDLGGLPPIAIEPVPLTIHLDGDGNIVISWPEGSGLFLFQTDALPAETWTLVAGADSNQAVLPAEQPARFYQLRHQPR